MCVYRALVWSYTSWFVVPCPSMQTPCRSSRRGFSLANSGYLSLCHKVCQMKLEDILDISVIVAFSLKRPTFSRSYVTKLSPIIQYPTGVINVSLYGYVLWQFWFLTLNLSLFPGYAALSVNALSYLAKLSRHVPQHMLQQFNLFNLPATLDGIRTHFTHNF